MFRLYLLHGVHWGWSGHKVLSVLSLPFLTFDRVSIVSLHHARGYCIMASVYYVRKAITTITNERLGGGWLPGTPRDYRTNAPGRPAGPAVGVAAHSHDAHMTRAKLGLSQKVIWLSVEVVLSLDVCLSALPTSHGRGVRCDCPRDRSKG